MKLQMRSFPPFLRVLGIVAIGLGGASEVEAQAPTATDLAELLPDLILRGITLPRPGTGELSHEAHFSPIEADEPNNPAVGIVQSFNKLMMVQLSTFPLGSSSGGFTYTFDEALGTFSRASTSFGPSFAERATTIGRRKLNAGATYQHTSYRSFEDRNLDDGSITFYLRHEECCSPGGSSGGGGGGGGGGRGPVAEPNGTRLSPPFEGDLIEAALSLEATTDTLAFFGNYGLTNRWDVGLVVPIVHVSLDASVQASILRLATETSPLNHTFEAGSAQATTKIFQQSGAATGLGDVLLRTKYHVMRFGGGGVAGALDVRLPTGDRENLLGAGPQVKVFGIVSAAAGRFAPHVNLGYTVSGGEVGNFGLLAGLGPEQSFPDELNYAVGSEFVAHPRVTLIADVVGRTLKDAGRLELRTKSFQYQREGSNTVQTAQFEEFDPTAGDINLALGTIGVKFNPTGNWLVSGSVLFPLTDGGLESRFTTTLGIDYAF